MPAVNTNMFLEYMRYVSSWNFMVSLGYASPPKSTYEEFWRNNYEAINRPTPEQRRLELQAKVKAKIDSGKWPSLRNLPKVECRAAIDHEGTYGTGGTFYPDRCPWQSPNGGWQAGD